MAQPCIDLDYFVKTIVGYWTTFAIVAIAIIVEAVVDSTITGVGVAIDFDLIAKIAMIKKVGARALMGFRFYCFLPQFLLQFEIGLQSHFVNYQIAHCYCYFISLIGQNPFGFFFSPSLLVGSLF